VVALNSENFLVGFLRRRFDAEEQSSLQSRRPEFDSGNSSQVNKSLSLVNGVGDRRGAVGAVGEVVMVIMTFVGTPTGCSRRFSTGGIIFCSRLTSTRIM